MKGKKRANQAKRGAGKRFVLPRRGVIAAVCVLALALLGGGAWLLFGPKQAPQANDKVQVAIAVKDYGTIALELYPDIAPITVQNFVDLAQKGFYDGLTFHRIISGFMIQGGDPKGDGTGGSGQNIRGEFTANGVTNTLAHTRGVISMARSSAYNSASSQFFIVHQDSPHLNGQYAAFGRVTEGMEVVDAICANTPVTDANGTVARENQPVIEKVTVITP